MRKIVFLDFDGVLNSQKYDRARGLYDSFLDETRLVLLKKLVNMTGAEIVLTTTWRYHWSKMDNECDSVGRSINYIFQKNGLEIADKTPEIADIERAEEIRTWLSLHKGEYDAFVIIDDLVFNWGELQDNVVKTSFTKGYGLEEEHIEAAYRILSRTANYQR